MLLSNFQTFCKLLENLYLFCVREVFIQKGKYRSFLFFFS